MNPADGPSQGASGPMPTRRRRLRAVFAADIANYGGLVTIDETKTLEALWITRQLATQELEAHSGWLFGMPGDGIFALFESTVDAVRCALCVQARIAESPKLHALKLRIGVHLGEILFQDELPYGEALVVASRLESLAEPGGILVSASVMDAVASRITATFVENGVRMLKHSPRRIETFRVLPPPPSSEPGPAAATLDRTVAPGRARLPKARPLVLPKETPTPVRTPPADAPTPNVDAQPQKGAAAGFDDASLSRLALLLTTHLGPMAKLVVRRRAMEMESHDIAKLIRILSQEIPAEAERLNFLMSANAVLNRPH
jgi:class 3 adenylate cyclase